MTKKKITKLTPEQEALLPVVRDEWIAHGLSCEPADRATAEEGVRLAYEAANLTPPRLCIWLGSPMAGATAAVMLPTWYPDGVDLDDPTAADQVVARVYDDDGRLRADRLPQNADRSRWSRYIAGNLWAGYYAWIDYYQRIGLDGLDAINGQKMVAMSAGWWWPMRDVCVLTDRPSEIHGEQVADAGWGSHRLHREDGPAVAYRDGWGVYAWHGTRVPGWVIEHPDQITARAIFDEANTEVRRVMCERVGWENVVDLAGLRELDRQPDPANPGYDLALYELPENLLDGEMRRVLLCTNASPERDGTRRRFGLTVPTEMSDAVAAAAWTFDLDRDTYAGLVRAT